MNSSKTMKWVGTAVFILFAIGNAIMLLVTNADNTPFGPEVAGPYSIFASYKFFVAYHVWGIIIAVVTTYALWKETRMLFWISLLLLMILMFYPYFTSSPVDKAQGEEIKQKQDEKARQDSIARLQAADSAASDPNPNPNPNSN